MRGYPFDSLIEDEYDAHSYPNCECVGETPLAVEIRLEAGHRRWVPKANLHEESEITGLNDTGVLAVFRWWAMEVGIDQVAETAPAKVHASAAAFLEMLDDE